MICSAVAFSALAIGSSVVYNGFFCSFFMLNTSAMLKSSIVSRIRLLWKYKDVFKHMSSKVPESPIYNEISIKDHVIIKAKFINQETIDQLECLALVDFANQAGIQRLEEAIQFANQLLVVDTNNVEPLITTLEDRHLYLQEDNVIEGNCRDAILKNAPEVEEFYFVAPKVKKTKQEICLPNEQEQEVEYL